LISIRKTVRNRRVNNGWNTSDAVNGQIRSIHSQQTISGSIDAICDLRVHCDWYLEFGGTYNTYPVLVLFECACLPILFIVQARNREIV